MAKASVPEAPLSKPKSAFEQIALVLQGGGALGAYQAGVYEMLHETSFEPDWLSGISIGAIYAGSTRLSLGAVNIKTGNFVSFDNRERRITPDHVMASGALPPGFPPVVIDGQPYWDGGLVSNTPLTPVLVSSPDRSTLVFQVDLFNARGELLGDLFEVEERRKQIIYSSRTRLNTDHFRDKHTLRRAIAELFEHIPPDARQDERVQAPRALGQDHAVSIVHLIYRRPSYEGGSSDYEFSRLSMQDHWAAGRQDASRTLRARTWRATPDLEEDAALEAANAPGKHGQAIGVEMDVANEDQVRSGVEAVIDHFGHLDILVWNAGIQIVHPLEKFPFEEWKQLLAIHLDGAFLTSRAALPYMYAQGSGSIVFMGSVHSKGASPAVGRLCHRQARPSRPCARDLEGRR